MGWLSWLFPSPEDRVRRARRDIDEGRPEVARLDLLDLAEREGAVRAEATALLHTAENVLAERNLEAAVHYSHLHEDAKAADCLALAETFHHGGLEARFQDTRRQMREIRAQRDAEAERQRAEAHARLLQVDPLGFTGGPSWLDPEALPIEADRDEIEARLALMIEQYPEALRDSVRTLGAEFALAVLALEEGRPAEALPRLLALPDDQPLVWWERARAAHALDDRAHAVSALQAFARLAGRHHEVGANHSGVYLAQLLAETGDTKGALRVLRDVRATSPKAGGFLFAQLLAHDKAFAEAEQVVTAMIREHPGEPALYTLLAHVRVAGGERVAAMRALESCLQAVCCTPGKCGSKAPDLETHRLLATLYLEDGVETERGLELAETAAALAQGRQWDDVYLQALVARTRNGPDRPALEQLLRRITPSGHPGAARVDRLLGSAEHAG